MSPLRLEPLMFAVEALAAATLPSGLMLPDLMPLLLQVLWVRSHALQVAIPTRNKAKAIAADGRVLHVSIFQTADLEMFSGIPGAAWH